MSTLLNIGTSGMVAQSKKMTTIGNNLANTQTPAFKAASLQFSDTFYRIGTSTAAGHVSQEGHGTNIGGTNFNWNAGGMQRTDKETHIAVSGRKGMIPVKHKDETMYSRAGDFSFARDDSGDIVLARPNGAQLMVEDDSGGLAKLTFSEVPSSIRIASDGKITIPTPTMTDPDGDGTDQPAGPGILAGGIGSPDIDTTGDGTLDGHSQAQIKLQAFGNPDTLIHRSNGLLSTTDKTIKSGDGIQDGDGTVPVKPGEHGTGSLQQGYLEESNVDLVKEFSDMIATQRAYQANSRSIRTADDLLKEALSLKR
ncbi:MAG: flagellar hook basal-body protein [Kiritimatiellia bacterium]